MTSEPSAHAPDTIALAAELTAAWLTNPHTRASSAEVLAFLKSMHEAVEGLSSRTSVADATSAEEHIPAVSARKSLADPDRIISMIDGKPYASLKRHLASHGLTPAEYRERFKLKSNYPMVAPGYSERRRSHAKQIGLGRKAATLVESAGAAIEQVAEKIVGKAEKGGKEALGAARKTLGIRT
ncbi:MucR family transcriptional regulator [Sphingomonas sp. RRHST34]|uniref:MucR family transcriptional regulator n=2 Tax=Sphingomonas citri TaxID=2862499 RepID=A0ABS7BSF2_9SPHN|nr:MucR family transcriptional regulator [Sphingomonas citri]MBW6532506.1 MucR family transcriptional regulator [Sphingomonas citri]